MKIDMNLKPGDIVLLKVLSCVLIGFFMLRFLIFPGIEKHQDLVALREERSILQQEMQAVIDSRAVTEEKILRQKEDLKMASWDYYEPMENHEIDELVTGIALDHKLMPVYLNLTAGQEGVPAAYQQSKTSNLSADAEGEDPVFLRYISTVNASVTLQGTEERILNFIDDIAKRYPGIQVRSFQMQTSTYVDSNLKRAEIVNCNCVLAVYICNEDTLTEEVAIQ